MTDSTQEVQQEEATGAQQNNDLNINDLNAMKTIIDIASSRGAFKPNEMMAVGQTYSKLTAFLDQVAKQADVQKGA
jgi:hypothetical protein